MEARRWRRDAHVLSARARLATTLCGVPERGDRSEALRITRESTADDSRARRAHGTSQALHRRRLRAGGVVDSRVDEVTTSIRDVFGGDGEINAPRRSP